MVRLEICGYLFQSEQRWLCLFFLGGLVRILKEGRVALAGAECCLRADSPPLLLAYLGTLVAGGMFRRAALSVAQRRVTIRPRFSGLEFVLEGSLFTRVVYDFIRRRRCVPESQNAVSICSFGCCCVWVPL